MSYKDLAEAAIHSLNNNPVRTREYKNSDARRDAMERAALKARRKKKALEAERNQRRLEALINYDPDAIQIAVIEEQVNSG